MSITLIFAPDAVASLVHIRDYIAADNPQAARSFLTELEERLRKTLTTFPLSGAVYQGNVRYFTIRGYVFLYEYHEDTAEIHVLDVYGRGEEWR